MQHPLVVLSIRYAREQCPKKQAVILRCIDFYIKAGENPVKYEPTPLKIVADMIGPQHERTMALFECLKGFFADNPLLEDEVMLVALVAGYDLRNPCFRNWENIMQLHDAVVHGLA